MKKLAFLSLILTSCSPPPIDVQSAQEESLTRTIDIMAVCALEGDSGCIYDHFSPLMQETMTRDDFKTYFENNREILISYFMRLRDAAGIEKQQFTAYRENDPCGFLKLSLSDGSWKVVREVHPQSRYVSIERPKEYLLKTIESKRFFAVLNKYANNHPEISDRSLRKLMREIAFAPIDADTAQFQGPFASININDIALLQFICSSEGWTLTQCTFLQ